MSEWGESKAVVEGHEGFVLTTGFDSDMSRLYSGSVDGALFVWDYKRTHIVDKLPAHQGPLNDLAIAGSEVATVGHDGCARLQASDGTLIRAHQTNTPLHAVDLHENRLVFAGLSGEIFVEVADGLRRMDGHTDSVECLATTGSSLISGSRDRSLVVWDLATGQLVRKLIGHEDWVTRIAVIDDVRILSVGEDGLAIAWDLNIGKEIWRVNFDLPIWGLGIRDTQAFIGKAGAPAILDLETKAVNSIVGLNGFAARAISVGKNQLVAMGHDGGGIDFVQPGESAVDYSISSVYTGVISAESIEDVVVTGHQSGAVSFVDRQGQSEVHQAHTRMAYFLARLPNGQLASAGFDGKVLIWDLSRRKQIGEVSHGAHVFSLSTSHSGEKLLTVGGNSWRLWNTDTWEEISRVENIGSGIHTLGALNREGATVTVGEDALMRIWRGDQIFKSIDLPFQDSSAILCSTDLDSIYVAANDGSVVCVSIASEQIRTLHAKSDSWIRQLKLSQDQRWLLSVSQNGVSIVYDLARDEVAEILDVPVAAADFQNEEFLVGVTGRGDLIHHSLT